MIPFPMVSQLATFGATPRDRKSSQVGQSPWQRLPEGSESGNKEWQDTVTEIIARVLKKRRGGSMALLPIPKLTVLQSQVRLGDPHVSSDERYSARSRRERGAEAKTRSLSHGEGT